MFADRSDAGRQLGASLREFFGQECSGDQIVALALPRGGVPVAYQVAKALGALLDFYVVRKLCAPQHPEVAMGAIASGGVRVINDEVVVARCTPQLEQLAETVERGTARARAKASTPTVANGRPDRLSRANAFSWSTTAWRPDTRCAPPSPHSDRESRRRSSSPRPSRQRTPARSSSSMLMPSSAW